METVTEFSDSVCPICMKDIECEKFFPLNDRGLLTMVNCALVYGHSALKDYIFSCDTSVRVHECCRKKYTDKRELENRREGIRKFSQLVPQKSFAQHVILLTSKETASIVELMLLKIQRIAAKTFGF